MSEQFPQTNPSPINPNQDQLFDAMQYDSAAQEAAAAQEAERQAAANELVASLQNNENEAANTTFTEEQATAARDALAILSANSEASLEAATLQRDWKGGDNAVEHSEKQTAHTEGITEKLSTRLQSYDDAALKTSRETKTADLKAKREAFDAKAAEERQTKTDQRDAELNAAAKERRVAAKEFLAKERAKRGEYDFNFNKKGIQEAADKFVAEKFGPTESVKQVPDNAVAVTEAAAKRQIAAAEATDKKRVEREAAMAMLTHAPQPKVPEAAPNDPEAKEASKGFSISYHETADGAFEEVYLVNDEQYPVDLAALHDKKIIINTNETDDYKGKAYYHDNGELYDLFEMGNTKTDLGFRAEDLSNKMVIVGQPLFINGKQITAEVTSVQIQGNTVDELPNGAAAETVTDPLESLNSPFEAANELLDEILQVEAAPELAEDETAHSRTSKVMNWARKRLAAINQASLAVAAKASAMSQTAAERFNNKRNGEKRNVLARGAGALVLGAALGGATYVVGHEVAEHVVGHSSGGGALAEHLPKGGSGVASEHASSATQHVAEHAKEHTPKAEHVHKLHKVTVHHGETISDKAVDRLKDQHHELSQRNIVAESHRIMNLNHINEYEAAHMADNTKIKV